MSTRLSHPPPPRPRVRSAPLRERAPVRDDDRPGIPPVHLLRERLDGAMRRQSHDLKAIGVSLHHPEGAPADRSRRTENGDADHFSASPRRIRT